MTAPHHRSAAGHQEQDEQSPASSSALPVAQDERELPPLPEPMKHGPFGGLYTGHQMREFARAALSAATPPAAVPMSQKTQDGHSTSRSGEAPTTPPAVAPAEWATKDMRILIYHLRHDTHFDADLIKQMLAFAQRAAVPDRIMGEPDARGYAVFSPAAASRRSAAGDQPSNGHGPESAPQPAGTQQPVQGFGKIVGTYGKVEKWPALPEEDAGTQSDTERDAARPAIQLGPEAFRFDSFQQWVNKAQGWFQSRMPERARAGRRYLALDAVGRVCLIGSDFHRARDEGAFPVVVYLIDAAMGNQSAGKESND